MAKSFIRVLYDRDATLIQTLWLYTLTVTYMYIPLGLML